MPNWKVTNGVIEVNEKNGIPFMYSEKVEDSLTFKYYDYLAWSIYKSRAQKVLLLGLGGGSVLQLLKQWNYTPSCTAVEIDEDLIQFAKNGEWLSYPNLNIVHSDASTYELTEKYDAIIVDLYSEQGYIQNMYQSEKIKLLFKHLTQNGSIYFHCFDPVIRFEAFNVCFSEKVPSLTFTIAQHIHQEGAYSHIIPYWTSSLIVASRQKIHPLFEVPMNEDHIERVWLDTFLLSKEKSVADLERHFTSFKEDYVFTNIHRINQFYLSQFFQSCSEEIKQKINMVLSFDPRDEKKIHAYQLNKGEIQEVTQTRVNAALLLSKLIQQRNDNELAYILQSLLSISHYDPDSSVMQLISYVYALKGDYTKALEYLHH